MDTICWATASTTRERAASSPATPSATKAASTFMALQGTIRLMKAIPVGTAPAILMNGIARGTTLRYRTLGMMPSKAYEATSIFILQLQPLGKFMTSTTTFQINFRVYSSVLLLLRQHY